MHKGDIVLLPFPFTNLKGTKTRPALILIASDLDITVAFITTQLYFAEPTDIILFPKKENGLKKESLLRLNKIATIEKSIVLGKLGMVGKTIIPEINKNLRILFDIK
ncbi:MAG: type II toxin-antitoxin system PemK/MazF family toxin [Bacteroidales bacterium]|nr:type II toxin-antitoxin system PemK/MazF family toxin [Bacteroidales bacterium]